MKLSGLRSEQSVRGVKMTKLGSKIEMKVADVMSRSAVQKRAPAKMIATSPPTSINVKTLAISTDSKIPQAATAPKSRSTPPTGIQLGSEIIWER
jgi:hypothetical protein